MILMTSKSKLTCGLTCTGVDSNTDISALPRGIEYGVLFSCSQEGNNRYPSEKEVLRITNELREANHRVALHVCGREAREKVLTGRCPAVWNARRIQINGDITPFELISLCENYPTHIIITQYNSSNQNLYWIAKENHVRLVDGSGGRGILPEEWSCPLDQKCVGFAGGLSPKNIDVELRKIVFAADTHFWVDMEQSLRDEKDMFDVSKVCVMDEFFRTQSFVEYYSCSS